MNLFKYPKNKTRRSSTPNPPLSEHEEMKKVNNMAEVGTLILLAKSITNSLTSVTTLPSNEAQKLTAAVSSIHQQLQATEDRLALDQNHQYSNSETLKSWVREVSGALYKASDLVDEAASDLAALLSKLDDRSLFGLCRRSTTCSSISGVRKGPEITTLCDELNRLIMQKEEEAAAPESRVLDPGVKYKLQSVETTAQLVMELLSRKDLVKEKIVGKLLDTSDPKLHFSVYALVGDDEPTLAKSIYNDKQITDHFDLKLWVSASDEFDIDQILKAIFLSCSPTSSGITSFVLKQTTDVLKRAITGNLLFLVLDHLADFSSEKWDSLRSLLQVCARGSKILVTTRSPEFAAHVCPEDNIYSLMSLQGTSWDVNTIIPSSADDLKSMIKTFFRKIKNQLIINIKVSLACMHTLQLEPYWRSQINPLDLLDATKAPMALMLSYRSLPVPLKVCFAYCSLFPQDHEFTDIDLVSLWMAQGYIEPEEPKDLEDIAMGYFQKLCKRHFFITQPEDDQYRNSSRTCEMHRFVHEIAEQVAGGWEAKIHLSFIPGRDKTLLPKDSKLDVMSESTRLQSFLHWTAPEDDHDDDAGKPVMIRVSGKSERKRISDILGMSNFKSLRVLDLHAFGLHVLPDSISNLIHIRYLDLSHNVSLQKLPNSISNLHHLQTLKLDCCYELRELPTTFGKLVNLRRLEINGCGKLICMPPGFENLSSLRMLSRYVVGRPHRQSSSGFAALGNLIHLRQRLVIELSENWASTADEARESNLSNKVKLNQLEIKWGPTSKKANVGSYRSLLDGLRPPTNLRKLQIEGYRGDDFPSWAKGNNLSTSLPLLISVSIDGCGKCETLPCFSGLPNLKRLSLRFMGDVKYFQSSTSESSPFFPVLEELTLQSFYNLEKWWEEEKQVQFRELLKLKIWSCPKLTSMPCYPKVEVLDMQNINEKLLGFHEVRHKYLKTVLIKNCLHLNNLALVQNSNGLEKLVVERLDMLKTVTKAVKSQEHLIELEIAGCKDLDLSLCECPKSCDTSKKCEAPWKSHSSLQRLTIKELPKLVKLPAGLRCFKTLKFLCISRCNNLKELPEFVSSLTSLQHLRLEACPALNMLPQGLKKINCLVKVDILECPLLMERCTSGGQDWDKIRHARVLCHKSWRYALMSEAEFSQKPKAKERNVVVHSEDPTIHVDVTVKRQVA